MLQELSQHVAHSAALALLRLDPRITPPLTSPQLTCSTFTYPSADSLIDLRH